MKALAAREEELMRLIAVKGLSFRQAANEMHIAESTVNLYARQAREKLGAQTTFHAVYLWLLSKAQEAR